MGNDQNRRHFCFLHLQIKYCTYKGFYRWLRKMVFCVVTMVWRSFTKSRTSPVHLDDSRARMYVKPRCMGASTCRTTGHFCYRRLNRPRNLEPPHELKSWQENGTHSSFLCFVASRQVSSNFIPSCSRASVQIHAIHNWLSATIVTKRKKRKGLDDHSNQESYENQDQLHCHWYPYDLVWRTSQLLPPHQSHH